MTGLLQFIGALARLFTLWQRNKDARAGFQQAIEQVEEQANAIVEEAKNAADAANTGSDDELCDTDPNCRD